MKNLDVYAYGMICPSRLIVLKNPFPGAGGYAEMDTVCDSVGGEAANSAIVLARLGLRVKLDGNWLPDDERGRTTRRLLRRFHIDVSRLRHRKACRLDELVVAFGKERTVFGRYATLADKQGWNGPAPRDIQRARAACIDPFFGRASRKACALAEKARVPYVTVDCEAADPIARAAAILTLSGEFRRRRYPLIPPDRLLRRYQARGGGLIVLTSGESGGLYGRAGQPAKRYRAPRVWPIDTSGAGDSFRAGMIFGLLKNWRDDQTIGFASALAAANCERQPGVLKTPSLQEILRRSPLRA